MQWPHGSSAGSPAGERAAVASPAWTRAVAEPAVISWVEAMKRQEKDVGQSPDESVFGLTTFVSDFWSTSTLQLRSQQELSELQQQHMQQFMYMQQQLSQLLGFEWIFSKLKIPSFLKTWRGCNRPKGAFLPMRWGHPSPPIPCDPLLLPSQLATGCHANTSAVDWNRSGLET